MPGSHCGLAHEERLLLGQDEGVRRAATGGHVGHRQRVTPDGAVDVSPSLLGQWPRVLDAVSVAEEPRERRAQGVGRTR